VSKPADFSKNHSLPKVILEIRIENTRNKVFALNAICMFYEILILELGFLKIENTIIFLVRFTWF